MTLSPERKTAEISILSALRRCIINLVITHTTRIAFPEADSRREEANVRGVKTTVETPKVKERKECKLMGEASRTR